LPIDLNAIHNQTMLVNNLQKELKALTNLIDLIYKILYYVEIPNFKNDRLNFYHKFLHNFSLNEKNMDDKYSIIFNYLKDHCNHTIEMYSQIVQK